MDSEDFKNKVENLDNLIKNKLNNNSFNNENFIKVDGDRILNVNFIRWIKKTDECFNICSRMDGCYSSDKSIFINTHSVCKSTNSESHHKILNLFN